MLRNSHREAWGAAGGPWQVIPWGLPPWSGQLLARPVRTGTAGRGGAEWDRRRTGGGQERGGGSPGDRAEAAPETGRPVPTHRRGEAAGFSPDAGRSQKGAVPKPSRSPPFPMAALSAPCPQEREGRAL